MIPRIPRRYTALIQNIRSLWPNAAREGSATLSYVINKNGVVTDIQVEDDSQGKAFADESVKALKQWRFAPRFVQGKAVDSPRQTVQLDFLLGT